MKTSPDENTRTRTCTQTITDMSCHPVAGFFKECGVFEGDFPRFRALIEVSETHFDSTTLYLPLRLPNHSGFIYESFWRIARTFEIPIAGSKKHRKFIDLEWAVREQALMEEQEHPALAMIAGEIECFSCKGVFVPDFDILDERSVQLSCPSCLAQWSVSVDSQFFHKPQVTLFNDQYHKDPVTFNRSLSEPQILWSDLYFRTHFEDREDGNSLEWLFGEQTGFLQIGPQVGGSFEDFIRSFLNFISLRYYQSGLASHKNTSQLSETEVFRKSEVEARFPPPVAEAFPVSAESQNFKAAMVSDPKFGRDAFTSATGVFSETKTSGLPSFHWAGATFDHWRRSPLAPLVVSASVVLMVFAGFGYMLFQARTPQVPVAQEERSPEPFALPEGIASDRDVFQGFEPMPMDLGETVPEAEVEAVAESPASTETASTEASVPEERQEVETSAPESSTASVPEPKVEETQEIAALPPEQVEVVPEVSEQDRARQAMVNSIYRQGAAHLRQSQYLEASQKFNQVVEMDPENFSAYLYLGQSLFQNRRLDEAKEAFISALDLNANSSQAHRNLGLVYFYSRDFPQAIASFESYLTLEREPQDKAQIEQLMSQMRSTLEASQSLLR